VTRPQASQPRRGARRALLALPAVVAGMFTLVPAGAGASPVPTSATVIVREMCQKVQCTLLPGQSSGGAAFVFAGGAGELNVAAGHAAAESLLARLYSPNNGYYYLVGQQYVLQVSGGFLTARQAITYANALRSVLDLPLQPLPPPLVVPKTLTIAPTSGSFDIYTVTPLQGFNGLKWATGGNHPGTRPVAFLIALDNTGTTKLTKNVISDADLVGPKGGSYQPLVFKGTSAFGCGPFLGNVTLGPGQSTSGCVVFAFPLHGVLVGSELWWRPSGGGNLSPSSYTWAVN
jgi:hypothetical protein